MTITVVTQAVGVVLSLCCATCLAGVVLLCPANGRGLLIVQLPVFALRHHLKVFRAIVVLDAVDVVNNLITRKRTAQHFRHDQAVFSFIRTIMLNNHDVSALPENAPMPLRCLLASLGLAGTSARAEHTVPASDFLRPRGKCLTARWAHALLTRFATKVLRRARVGAVEANPLLHVVRTGKKLFVAVRAHSGYGTLLGHRSSPFGVRLPAVCSSAGALLSLHYSASGRDKQA